MIVRACMRHGAYWTIENPKSSFLFKMPSVLSLCRRRGVHAVSFDQCAYGLREGDSELFYVKPTTLIGNLPKLLSLQRSCPGNHAHQRVEGTVKIKGKWCGRSVLAGAYPHALASAIASLVKDAFNQASSHKHLRQKQLLGRRSRLVSG